MNEEISEEMLAEMMYHFNTSSFNISDPDDFEEVVEGGFGKFTLFSIIVCVFYGILFCFGLCGNVWVIGVITYILKSFRGLTQNQNMFLYVLTLSIVDTLVLLNLPMLICDIFYVRWIFGGSLCKMYWIIESVNKVVSKFILMAMSFDRYLAVCRPNCLKFVRSIKGTVAILMILSVIVVVSLYPVYVYAEEVQFDEIYIMNNRTVLNQKSKCLLLMDEHMLLTFTISLFVVGFCLPSAFIIFFYIRILFQVHAHKVSMVATSQIPFKRVTAATFLLIVIYFSCWTPFWITVLYSAFQTTDSPSVTSVYVMYFVHLLVYVNSAINWILYAFLNNNLKETRVLAVKRNATSRTRLLEIIEGRPRHRLTTFTDSLASTGTNQWV